MDRLTESAVAAAVASAFAEEIGRSTLVRHEVERDFWSGSRREVERLRRLVADQAATIADLSAALERAQARVRRLELAELVDAVSGAVLGSSATMNGYVVSDARVEVKAALEIADGRLSVTADPGGLVDTAGLSTVSVHLRPIPPPLGKMSSGEMSLPAALDLVRTAAADLQTALETYAAAPAVRAPALAAVSDLLTGPAEADRWARLATALAALVETGPAGGGRAAVGAARAVAGGLTPRRLVAAGQGLARLAADLRDDRG
jgi:hypothetical protein